MSRRPILALAISLAVHAAAGLAIWHWESQVRVRSLPARVAVDLSSPLPAAIPEAPGPGPPQEAAPAEPLPGEAARAEPLPAEPPTAGPPPALGPANRPVTTPPAWEPRPYPRPVRRDHPARSFRSPRRYAGGASDWWSRRSAVALVEAWRVGEAPRDSVLDRRQSHAERILASTSRGLNGTFLRLRREWREEEFRRKYAENFPPMGQIPAEPEP